MFVDISTPGGSSSGSGVQKVADAAALAALAGTDGDFAVQVDTNDLYQHNGAAWLFFANWSQVSVVASAGGTTALTNTSNPIQIVTGTLAQTFTLPNGTTMPKGKVFRFVNNSSQDLTVNTFSAGDTFTIAKYRSHNVYLQNNASADGTWYADDYRIYATDIINTPSGNLGGATVQAALNELQGDIDTLNSSSHAAATIAAFGAVPNNDGLSISGQAINMQPADHTHPGGVSTGTQFFAGEKDFDSAGVGGSISSAANTVFEVQSTTKGAIPAPSMSTAQRNTIATPQTGHQIYNSTQKHPEFYNGTLWEPIGHNYINSTATITAGGNITPADSRKQLLPVTGDAAAVTAADIVATAGLNGDELIIIGGSDTNTVTIVSATNTVLNGSCTLGLGDVLTLIFLSSKWYEKSRSA